MLHVGEMGSGSLARNILLRPPQVPDAVRGALDRARTEDDLDADSRETLRFPLSLAESRLDVDKQGEPATVYDCVLNNEVQPF